MPEPTYTKADVDEAFAQGVAHSEKLWQQIVPKLMDEGSFEVTALVCQKCGSRYQHKPEQKMPKVVLCPSCMRYNNSEIGVCRVETRRVGASNQEVRVMQNALMSLMDPLITLREVLHSGGAAGRLTASEALQLPQAQRLLANLQSVETLRAGGWRAGVTYQAYPDDPTEEVLVSQPALTRYVPKQNENDAQ